MQNLHHSRDQASSSLRNPKLTTPGTMSGAGMAGESKVLYVCSYTDSSFEIRLMSLLGEKNLLTYVQVYFASELEGGNQVISKALCIYHDFFPSIYTCNSVTKSLQL